MTDDAPQTDTENPELTPASKNIWYALATIAGEPKRLDDEKTIIKNRYYWNGYMREIASSKTMERLNSLVDDEINLPVLSDEDKAHIRQILKKRGFRGQTWPLGPSIDFDDVEFSDAHFSGYVFLEPTTFRNCKFSGWSNFRAAIFMNFTEFIESSFLYSNFSDCVFTTSPNFEGCEFQENVDFYDTKFLSRANFRKCIFANEASFINTQFSRDVDYSNSSFFGDARFNGSNFSGQANYKDTHFHKRLDFGYWIGGLTDFQMHPPEFFNSKVSEEVSWAETKFPSSADTKTRQANDHKDAYERLALMMDKLKKHHDRHMFFRLEMQSRRHMEKKWSLARFINWSYEKLSDYGYGTARAFSLWLSNIGLGAVLLFGQKFEFGQIVPNFWNSIATSFSNAHGFLGLGRGPLKNVVADYQAAEMFIPYNVIATVQTIAGAVFLFFLLLTLRNRFRMG